MARPVVHQVTEDLYASLGGGLTSGDEATGWQLLEFCDAVVGEVLGPFDDLVRDSPSGPGWSMALDVDRIDIGHLAWLAQFVGVAVPAGLSDAEARARVTDAEGWKRGRPAAIAAAAASHLTGSRKVHMVERDGGAYRLTVKTYRVQTPDPVLTEKDVRTQKPASILLAYSLIEGEPWQQVKDNFATWGAVKAAFATWSDLRDWIAP